MHRHLDATIEIDRLKARRAQLNKSRTATHWQKGQLAVNARGVKFEIGKVTAKRVHVRQLLPRDPEKSGTEHFLDQLLFDFGSVEGKTQGIATKVDDDFLWGSKCGHLQRVKEGDLLPWPTEIESRQKKKRKRAPSRDEVVAVE